MKNYTLKNFEPTGDFKIDYRAELNDEQYRAVTSGDGPCLVLAGAGSGKTRTLVYRVAYLLEKGVAPNRILLVTFTNKAAKEMLSRIELLLKSSPQGLWGGTFHHIGNRILRIYGESVGVRPNFNILDAEDAKALVKASLSGVNIPADKTFPKADLIYKIISLSANLSRPLDEVISVRFGQINEDYIPLIEKIAEVYRRKKTDSNSLDFDDLLYLWSRLLMENEGVREKLSRQFEHVLVDEYQDTNYIQGQIVANLAGPARNVFVVGDDSQSIYSFRGADVNNILDFPKIFPGGKTFKLETNYRSTPEILSLANHSIEYNRRQFQKELRTSKSSGAKPAAVPLDDAKQQAEFVCQRISDLERDKGLGPDKIAVLFRAHFQSLELELELNRRGIPYVMRGGLRFFEQAHIKDIIAFLKIIANCHDEAAWRRILLLQSGIGEATMQKIYQQIAACPDLPLVVSLERDYLPAKSGAGFGRLQDLLRRLSGLKSDAISSMIEIALNDFYRDYLKANYENYQDRLADLEQLIAFAGDYDDLEKFLSDTALGEGFKGEAITDADGSNAVILSTIHQAKGLEWPVVFIIGLVDGQFPNAKVFERSSDMEEERRLFYVAATRAQDELYLVYPQLGFGGNFNSVSQFLRELPEKTYEDWRVKEAKSDQDVVYVDEDDDSVTANFWQRVKARRERG